MSAMLDLPTLQAMFALFADMTTAAGVEIPVRYGYQPEETQDDVPDRDDDSPRVLV